MAKRVTRRSVRVAVDVRLPRAVINRRSLAETEGSRFRVVFVVERLT